MNIGPIVRGLLGESRAGQSKELELKMGQVIRGVVLSVSDDGLEAVVQVQGVQLRAALETPLQKGQTTLLQVQPPGKDGMVVLKPINPASAASLSEVSLGGMLDSFGIENTPENRELLKLMQSQGIPLTKDQALAIRQSLAGKPQGLPLEQWVQSAAIAFHRGLPVTASSVAGLHQAVFGTSLQNLLSELDTQVADLLSALIDGEDQSGNKTGGNNLTAAGQGTSQVSKDEGQGSSHRSDNSVGAQTSTQTGTGAAGTAASNPKGSELLMKIQGLLEELRTLGSQAASSEPANSLAEAPDTESPVGRTPGSPSVPIGGAGTGTGAEEPGQATAAKNILAGGMAGANPTTAATGNQGLSTTQVSGNGTEEGAHNLASMAAGISASVEDGDAAPAAAALKGGGEAPAAASPARTHESETWVSRVLKLLGAEHEQMTARTVTLAASPAQPDAPPAEGAARAGASASGAAAPGGEVPAGSAQASAPGEAAPARSGAAAVPGTAVPAGQHERPAAAVSPAVLPDVPASAEAEPAAALRETLKSVLMQVLDSGDLPAQLQDTAKQLVNQLTGQQLLMNTDRTAPFAQLTMFLPFTGPDGDQTASVHIQSRRGKRGELDASNCRLWFDLQMKHLGQIMVDVQVADKKVILRVHSEEEVVGGFIESRQAEISQAIESAGYLLLSLKAEPMEAAISKQAGSESMPPLYVPQSYKGVDYRI